MAGAQGFEPGNGGIKIRQILRARQCAFRKIAPASVQTLHQVRHRAAEVRDNPANVRELAKHAIKAHTRDSQSRIKHEPDDRPVEIRFRPDADSNYNCRIWCERIEPFSGLTVDRDPDHFRSAVAEAVLDVGNAIAMGTSGNVLVTGSFAGAVDFGSGPLTNAGSSDIFLLCYAP